MTNCSSCKYYWPKRTIDINDGTVGICTQVQNEDALEDSFRQAAKYATCGLIMAALAVRHDHRCGKYKKGTTDNKPNVRDLKP